MPNVIITAAVTGSRPTKAMNPAVPYTPAEIADAAVDCWRAGAAIAHIHVRDPQTGVPSSDITLFREVLERIRARCDMLVNLTTSGLNITGDSEEIGLDQRLEPATLRPRHLLAGHWLAQFYGSPLWATSPFWRNACRWQRCAAFGVKPGSKSWTSATSVRPASIVFTVSSSSVALSLGRSRVIVRGASWHRPALASMPTAV